MALKPELDTGSAQRRFVVHAGPAVVDRPVAISSSRQQMRTVAGALCLIPVATPARRTKDGWIFTWAGLCSGHCCYSSLGSGKRFMTLIHSLID